MMEDDMKRNGSGYYDETPVKSGVLTGPQPGEIWESSQGKEALVLKNHGAYCTTLFVRNEAHSDTIEIISRDVRHVNPSMLGYIFNRDLAIYIKTIPQEQYLDIMQAVGERLGVTIKVSRDNNTEGSDKRDEYIKHLERAVLGFEGQAEDAKRDLEEANRVIDCLARERDAIRAELREFQKNTGHDDVVSAVKAEMFENLYKELLQKCLARGEAK